MIILGIRTDKPEAELYLYNDKKQLGQLKWQAHRELSDTIHQQIDNISAAANQTLNDIEGIICFKGPGSFTGLRIGLSVSNALAYSNQVPIVTTVGKNWLATGIKLLGSLENEKIALPQYDKPAVTTKPRK